MSSTLVARDPGMAVYCGDAVDVLRKLVERSVDACVTSPPYLDMRPEYDSPTFVEFEQVFWELARVIKPGGCCLVNVGRLWRGHREQLWWLELLKAADYGGWELLDTEVWTKPNANPIHGEVFANRHEYVLVLARAGDYRANVDEIRKPYAAKSAARMERGWIEHVGVKGDAGKRSSRKSKPHPLGGRPPSYVEVFTGGEKGNKHPAPMPVKLAKHLVKLATWPGQRVIDPFAGSGTTGLAARRLGRSAILIDKNADYCDMAARRTRQLALEV